MEDATSNHHPVLAQSSLEASNGAATTGGFIALDVAALSSLAGDDPDTTATAPAASTPRTPRVVRSLSRKGSERKQADGDASNGATGGGGGERPLLSPLLVHVAAGDEMLNGFRLVNTPGGAGTPGGKSRRLGRRPAPWLDPRRVVFLFATLSSVGTLILLYFTLSMTKMDGAGSGTGADSDAR